MVCFEFNLFLGFVCGGFCWVNEVGEMLVDVEFWDEFLLLDWEIFLVGK